MKLLSALLTITTCFFIALSSAGTPAHSDFIISPAKQGKKGPSLNRLKDNCCDHLKGSMHQFADLLRSTANGMDSMAIAVDAIANGDDALTKTTAQDLCETLAELNSILNHCGKKINATKKTIDATVMKK